MKVPFLDLDAAYQELKSNINKAVLKVLNSGWYVQGQELEAFEYEWASFCNAKHAVGLGNGLDALHLSLLALGVKAGDEVIVPKHTFIATWMAVSHCGAIPIAVDCDKRTFNIRSDLIEAAITSRTKAIIPVHLYGRPADLHPIIKIAKKYKLPVLEDAAQAHGSIYKGERIGAHGDIVAWSFYPGKNLGGMGDGGAITTNRDDLASTIKLLRNYGSSKKYHHDIIGYNSRLDDVQAAILRVKLKVLDEWNARRVKIAQIYLRNLKIKPITLPAVDPDMQSVWHLFVLSLENSVKDLIKHLDERGIDTKIHYPVSPSKQPPYLNSKISLNKENLIFNNLISLPIGPHLELKMVEHVIESIQEFYFSK